MSTISAIELHLRTYRSALKSNQEIALKSLENTFIKMHSLLHAKDALVYALARLPKCIDQTKTVILGQRPEVFAKAGFKDVLLWPQVESSDRRRRLHFDKKTHTLAVFIASVSDTDDIVNLLLAYQTETNKTQKSFVGLRLRLLAGSWNDYAKTTQRWWKNIARATDPKIHMSRQTIYFVSSNSYSLKNLIGNPRSIITIPSAHYLDINTQIIPIKNLVKSKKIDPALKIKNQKKLAESDALIFNIDYPLGFSASLILTEVLQNVEKIKGVYILGKAAVLNGEIGDIYIPKAVFDEHSQNTYLFDNCFNNFLPARLTASLRAVVGSFQGSLLTNQKAVSVLGTFLQNQALIDKYSKNNFTVIEMESGPYLSAVTQATYDQTTPKDTIVDLHPAPFDIGIVNYTSDTPYSQVKNLGQPQDNSLLDIPIHLSSLAILQRIINLEEASKT